VGCSEVPDKKCFSIRCKCLRCFIVEGSHRVPMSTIGSSSLTSFHPECVCSSCFVKSKVRGQSRSLEDSWMANCSETVVCYSMLIGTQVQKSPNNNFRAAIKISHRPTARHLQKKQQTNFKLPSIAARNFSEPWIRR